MTPSLIADLIIMACTAVNLACVVALWRMRRRPSARDAGELQEAIAEVRERRIGLEQAMQSLRANPQPGDVR